MPVNNQRFETLALHGGSYRVDPATGAVAVPLYQTTPYQFQNTSHASRLFALEEHGRGEVRRARLCQRAGEEKAG